MFFHTNNYKPTFAHPCMGSQGRNLFLSGPIKSEVGLTGVAQWIECRLQTKGSPV